MKIIAENKKARFDYFVEETFEAGIRLDGAEVKSLRAGNCSLRDCFAFLREGSVWLKNAYIAPYEKMSAFNEREPRRDRRLLLHKREIDRLAGKINQKGLTLVPLKLYFKDALLKVELGLCRGKQSFDKREVTKDREVKRSLERAIKDYNR